MGRKLRRSLNMHINIRIRHSVKALENLQSCLADYGLSSPATQLENLQSCSADYGLSGPAIQLSAKLKDSLYSLAHIVNFNQSIVGPTSWETK